MPFRRLRIFHRIAVHGVLLLVATAASAIAAFHLVEGRSQPQDAFSRAAVMLAREIEATDGSREAMESRLAPFHYISDSPVAVFTADGEAAASLGKVAVPPLTRDEYRRVSAGRGAYPLRFAEVAVSLTLPSGPGYLVVTWRHSEEMHRRFVLILVIALVVIALMSIPVARSIAKPVRAITETAERLRDGDLHARAEVDSRDELALLARTLNEMAEGLDTRIRREKELLANVSHELRTPLARIRVALEIAAESERLPPEVERQLDEIGADIRELDQLVGDVLFSTKLDFSSGDGAPFGLTLEETPLVPFLEETVSRFQAATGRAVERAFPPQSPAVRIDPALFRRVIDNLLGNSRKYSREETPIEIALEVDGKVTLSIRDRGMGVPEESLERLFEPFFRTEKSRSRNAGGMGLGLTLAKRIVEAHGGRIFAESRSGGGLAVVVQLPLAPAS